MERARRYWDDFNDRDPVTQAIALVALIIIIVIVLPWFPVPWVSSGGACVDYSAPKLNGNNGSILGNQITEDALRLEVVPNTIQIPYGQPLQFDVRFINDSMAPVNLFLEPDSYVFRYNQDEDGLMISILTTTNQPLGEPASSHPPSIAPQQFQPAQLHTLRPRQRCTVTVTIEPNRLAAAQVAPGQYSIIAVYRNRSKGAVSQVGQRTPTPIFTTQGVWTGQVLSNKLQLIVGNPATPPQ